MVFLKEHASNSNEICINCEVLFDCEVSGFVTSVSAETDLTYVRIVFLIRNSVGMGHQSVHFPEKVPVKDGHFKKFKILVERT